MKAYAHKKDNSFLEFNLTGKGISGGEGTVYKIDFIPGLPGKFCAKVYHREFLTKHKSEKYAKLSYMVANRPQTLSDNVGMMQICYPAFLLFDAPVGGNFIGYVMYLALENSTDLQKVSMIISKARFDSLRRNGKPDIIGEEIFRKFPRPHKSSEINQLANRYKLVHNIASLINYFHRDGRYVIGDIKPDNILMTTKAGISLVDVDSVQITSNNKLLFPNEASTPEYCPPEFLSNPKQKKEVSFDLFSMAVLFYQILIGTHPYTYTIPNLQQQNDITGNIKTGYFANGKRKRELNRPPCHSLFDCLPKDVKSLFIRAFEGIPNQRPSASEWKETMKRIITSETKFTHSTQANPNNSQQGRSSNNQEKKQPTTIKRSNNCPYCGRPYYSLLSKFCDRCGKPRK